jgi:hypothetical protein
MIAQRIGPREEPAADIADSDALTREQAAALVSRMTGQYGHWVSDMKYYNRKLLLSAVVGETPGGTATSPKGCMQNMATPDPVAKHDPGTLETVPTGRRRGALRR